MSPPLRSILLTVIIVTIGSSVVSSLLGRRSHTGTNEAHGNRGPSRISQNQKSLIESSSTIEPITFHGDNQSPRSLPSNLGRKAVSRRSANSFLPPTPKPIRPGELSAFEPISFPLGRPSYDGESVTAYVRVGSLARDLALSVNQGGEYPRVPVLPGETIEIRLSFTESPPDTTVALNAEDGGIVTVNGQGDRSVAGKLDEQRQLCLSYRVTGTTGVHRVALRTPDGDTKVLEFWAGDPPVKKTLP